MIENRLVKIEEMLATLISMVGVTNSKYQSLEDRFTGLEEKFVGLGNKFEKFDNRLDTMEGKFVMLDNRLDRMEEKFEGRFQTLETSMVAMRKENAIRVNEIDTKLNSLLAEQEFIWEKAARNEREIGKMKNQLGL